MIEKILKRYPTIFFAILFSLSSFVSYADQNLTEKLDMSQVWKAIDKGEFKIAENFLEDFLKKNPQDIEAEAALGHLYFEIGEWKLTEQLFEKVIEKGLAKEEKSLTKKDKVAMLLAYTGYAEMLLRELKYEQAELVLLRAMTFSKNPVAYDMLGEIARKFKKDLVLSETIHKEILAAYLQRCEWNKVHLAIVYFQRGNKDAAEKMILQVREPENYPLEMAAYYSVVEKPQGSLRYLRKMVEKYKNYPRQLEKIYSYLQRDPDFKNFAASPWFAELQKSEGKLQAE